MKTAYIASPYRADTKEKFEEQLTCTKKIARELVLASYDVIVPHLYYPLFLDDNKEIEREMGIRSALNLLEKCDIVFATEKVSSGMAGEIARAEELNIPVIYFSDIHDLLEKAKNDS